MQSITKRLIGWTLFTGLVLAIPLIGMQISNEWIWDLFDFVFMGALLLGSTWTYELITRNIQNSTYKYALSLAIVTTALLLWINGAVGIIGDGPVNLMYFAVLGIGVIGSIASHFQATGMSCTLFAMALAQALIPAIAAIAWNSQISWNPNILGVLTLNTFFVALFLLSALLFRRSRSKNSQ